MRDLGHALAAAGCIANGVRLMPGDYRPIDTAPRDGTLIEVMDPDCGSFPMRWERAGHNPLVSTGLGIWMAEGGDFTWCEDHGCGPTWWRPMTESHLNRRSAQTEGR